jgi:hypothetical protein
MTPENVIEKWANYFNAGDLEGITSLYHKDSTLLPTFLPKLLASKEQISSYFIAVIEGKASIEVNVSQSIKKVVSENTYLMTGTYVFCLPSKGGEKFESWYSFLIDLSDDSPIRHHHSSRVPFDFDLSH